MNARGEHRGTTGGPSLKIALVGYGRWGANVARDLSTTEGAALTHVVDVNGQALDRAAGTYPAAAVTARLADVLDAVDAVAICTPPETHADLAAEALAASKHVFVEKPFAMAAAAASQLEELAAARGTVLMAGHQMLYHGAFEELRQAVSSGALGALRAVRSERFGMVDTSRDPGVLWAYGPHGVAMILALAGSPPRAVRAVGAGRSGGDEVSITLEFDGGLVGTALLRGWASTRSRRLKAVCERGEIVFDESVPHGAGAPLARELAEFIRCASSGERPRSDGRHGVLVTRVLCDAERMLAEERSATSSFRWSRALS